jgi:DNA-binding response OmpR family regulator
MNYEKLIHQLEVRGDALTITAAKAIRKLLQEKNEYKTTRQVGRLKIYLYEDALEVDEKPFHLTRNEFLLLQLIAKHKRTAPKEDLFISLYGYDSDRRLTDLDVLVSKIRKKLNPVLGYDCLETRWGLGWRLVEPSEELVD